MSRFFTLQQAQAIVPKVQESVRQAVHLKQEHEKAESEVRAIHQRVALAGGMVVNQERMMGLRARYDATGMRLKEILEEIHALGCQVKDLELGLVDFPTLYHGQEVLLCWKLGEQAIEFWHGLTEGFRGRKQIDGEFLKNHRGDSIE